MKRARLRPSHALLVLGVSLALATPAARAELEDRLEKSFPVSPGGRLVIQADRGSIDIKTAETDTVSVEVTRTARTSDREQADRLFGAHEVTFRHEGNQLEIVAGPQGALSRFRRDLWNRLQVRYVVTLPRRFDVDLQTAGGSITVADLIGIARAQTAGGGLTFAQIDGPVSGQTSGGSIRLESCTKNARLKTSGGSIEVGEVQGTLDAQTSGGSIRVERAGGDTVVRTSGGNVTVHESLNRLDAGTSGGSIHLGKVRGAASASTSGGGVKAEDVSGTLDASTTGGSISARFSSQLTGDCSLKTTGGGIEVELPKTIAADLDATAIGGRVISDLPVAVVVQGEQKRNHLQGRINGGGPALMLRTTGGSIHLRPR